MECFTMLPNNLFYSTNGQSLFQELKDYKLLLVMDYLHMHNNRLGLTAFSLQSIITYYNYKVDRRTGGMNSQIKDIVKFLVNKGIIDCTEDIDELKPYQYVGCKYNGISIDDDGNSKNFTTINYDIWTKILIYNENKIDNNKLLFYYCYLCSRMYIRVDGTHVADTGGRAEVCFPSYETIYSDIGIKDKTIKQYNDILVAMNLIRIGNLGLYYHKDDKNKVPRESPNFYASYSNDSEGTEEKHCKWYTNLKEGKKLYKKQNPDKVFIGNRNYKNNNKSINGFISRINALDKQGKATTKQLEKRDKYLLMINSENIK